MKCDWLSSTNLAAMIETLKVSTSLSTECLVVSYGQL